MKYNIYVKRSVAKKAWENLPAALAGTGLHNPHILLVRDHILPTRLVNCMRVAEYNYALNDSDALYTLKEIKQIVKLDNIQELIKGDAPIRPQDLRIVPRPDLED